jgi:hypothetical protein
MRLRARDSAQVDVRGACSVHIDPKKKKPNR